MLCAVVKIGFKAAYPSQVAKFLRLVGVAAVLSIVGYLGSSEASNPLSDPSLVGIPVAKPWLSRIKSPIVEL